MRLSVYLLIIGCWEVSVILKERKHVRRSENVAGT